MPELGEVKRIKYANGGYYYPVWNACPICGKERWVNKRKLNRLCRRCSDERTLPQLPKRGPEHHGWRGGRSKNAAGYIDIWLSPDDFFFPMARKSDQHVLEHRLVMAKHLNRCLLPWEIVHHKNGIRDDNRFENLELLRGLPRHEPSMKLIQRVRTLERELAKTQKLVIWLASMIGQRKEALYS